SALPLPPSITSLLNVTGTQNSPFSYQITASNSPNSYNATGLPSGLSVNTATGLISGTPTVSGSFSATLTASNGGGTGTAVLALTVNPPTPPPPPSITSSLTTIAAQNSQFRYQITATNSPTSYGASGLPAGLSIGALTGIISGTPTVS